MHALEQLARTWFTAVEARDFDALAGLYAPDAEFVRSDGHSKGVDAIITYMRRVADGFPDEAATIQSALVSDGAVTVEWTESATHTAPYTTEHFGVIEPTGKSYSNLRIVDIFRIGGGKIVSQHSYYDLFALIGQLGWLERFARIAAAA